MYLVGGGASEDGARPFLDAMSIDGGDPRRLWRSADDCYESVVALLPDGSYLTRRTSPTEPTNVYVLSPDASSRRSLPSPANGPMRAAFASYRQIWWRPAIAT